MENWEIHKENFVPIKCGRSINNLEKTTLLRPKADFSGDKQFYESRLIDAKGNSKELLIVYLEYIKWIKQTFATSNIEAKSVFEVTFNKIIIDNKLFDS